MPRLSCTRLAVVGQGRGTLRDAILSSATDETLAYIAAVEAADEQRLEDGVLAAMVTFANWRIPLGGACCLLAGARTLAGALTPMVGPAPIGVNLVEGDYNRSRVQLNGSTKALDTEFDNATPGQNDRHFGVNIDSAFDLSPIATTLFVSSGSGGGTAFARVGSGNKFVSCSSLNGVNRGALVIDPGSVLVARQSSSVFEFFANGANANVTVASDTPGAGDMIIGSNAALSGTFFQGGIRAYSGGPYIAPADLDTRMTAAVNAIDRALNPLRYAILDQLSVDTLEYLFAVEAADGERLENDVLAAMGSFAEWRIPLGGACCLLAGARTLAGALTPMVGPPLTGVNLVEGDYDRARIQFGTNKRLDLGFTSTVMPQDDCHVAISIAESFDTASSVFLFGGLNVDAHAALFTPLGGSATLRLRLQGNQIVLTGGPVADGIYTARRLSGAEVRVITPTQDFVSSNSSVPQVDHPMSLGANGNGGAFAPLKSYFFSCGLGLDTVDLRSRVTSLANAIAAALA